MPGELNKDMRDQLLYQDRKNQQGSPKRNQGPQLAQPNYDSTDDRDLENIPVELRESI